jgi:flagellar protein FlaF
MVPSGLAMKAYAAAAAARDPRAQEAELFRQVAALLRAAERGNTRQRLRALLDNRLLWNTVIDLLRDPDNALPAPLRAAIISVGLAVQREMQRQEPDFGFLIAVNENIGAGLARSGAAGA